MIRSIARAIGSLAFFAASAAFLTAVSLFLLGAFFLTWPVMRKSPRERRLHATMRLAAAGLELMGTFAHPEESYTDGEQ